MNRAEALIKATLAFWDSTERDPIPLADFNQAELWDRLCSAAMAYEAEVENAE